jgi:nicotinate phosphoribosyltransferase
MGGFDGTSNVLAGKLFGMPVKGTHAHSFVQSYSHIEQIKDRRLDKCSDFVALAQQHRDELG